MELSRVRIFLATLLVGLTFGAAITDAKDVHVRGYHRKDGTDVRPYIRSSPDEYLWNNYGPSTDSSQLLNPRSRDADGDGVPNYLDHDDDNDGIQDDKDSSQY